MKLHSWIAGLAALVVLSGCSSGNDYNLAGPAPTTTPTWHVQDTGVPFNSVWGSSGSDVFAVGYGGAILHYGGSAWKPMASRTGVRLVSVWGSSGSNVYAVGDLGTILHYRR